VVGVLAGLAVLLTACSSSSSSSHASTSSQAANKSPIKVGYILPLTGNFTNNGKEEQAGFELGLQTFGTSVDGHPIDVTYLNGQGSPTVSLSDATELISQDHVQVVEGPLLSSSIAAVSPYVMGQGVVEDDLNLASVTLMNDYKKYGLGFTSGWDSYTPPEAGARWAYDDMHWRHVTTIGSAFSFGWQVVGGFDAEFTALGGTIDKSIWVPLNATDLSSYISQIPSNTQAVYVELSGAQALNFVDEYQSFGLKGKIPLLGITQLTDQSVLPSENPTAALGTYTDAQYCDGISSSANDAFVKAYHAKYGTYPGYYSDSAYVQAEILVDALKALHGVIPSEKALAKAMLAVHISAPRGPVTISSVTDSPIQNSYICKVEDVNGALRNVPIKTYPAMQPWGFLSESTWLHDFTIESSGPPPGT
jgi:branched-chain amino acid transport system substrate-binding protein